VSIAQSPAAARRITVGRYALAWLIAAFLLWVALLPAPPLPHAVHDVLRSVLGHQGQGGASSPAWLATFLRKAPEALLYFLLAVLLSPRGPGRIRTFLGVGAYGLVLEFLRPLHGRAFEGLDVAYAAGAALLGAYLPAWFLRHAAAASVPPA